LWGGFIKTGGGGQGAEGRGWKKGRQGISDF